MILATEGDCGLALGWDMGGRRGNTRSRTDEIIASYASMAILWGPIGSADLQSLTSIVSRAPPHFGVARGSAGGAALAFALGVECGTRLPASRARPRLYAGHRAGLSPRTLPRLETFAPRASMPPANQDAGITRHLPAGHANPDLNDARRVSSVSALARQLSFLPRMDLGNDTVAPPV